jgi:rhamnosyltransferase
MVGAGFPPSSRGGTEAHMLDLARGLRDRGHEVAVFARRTVPGLADLEIARRHEEGISVLEFNQTWEGVRDFSRIHDDPRVDALFAAELERVDPQLVHVHHLSGLSLGILDLAKARSRALVVTLHDHWMACLRGQRITPALELCTDLDRARCAPCLHALWPSFGIGEARLRAADARVRRGLCLADRWITPSRFHGERMLELGLDRDRWRVVEHGLSGEAPAHAVPRPLRRVGYLGSILPSKGVHVLVEALRLLDRTGLECHLHGEAPSFHGDTGYLDRLRAFGVPLYVHGPYDREELPRILCALDLVVVPSLWWESFALTLREAMAAGVPVLASDHGALREALAGTGEPILFRPGDAQDLARKIAAIAEDDALRARLRGLGARVHPAAAMVEETLAVYREAVGDPDRVRAHRAALASARRKGAPAPYVTVFIPTWNSGETFEGVLAKVLDQETSFDYEVLIIDSGSRDGTLDRIRAHPEVRLIEIPNEEFNHGLTRNRAVFEARGEIVVLLTHDAEPYDRHWLETLVGNFADPEVAGAYCHQIPRTGCNPFQRDRLRGWTHGEGQPERRRLSDPARFQELHPFERYRLIAFDDVASAVRKSVMQQIPFEKRQFGEDVAWARAAILAGHTLVMDPRATVIHSHDKSIWYEFKRVYLDHQNLHILVGLHTVPSLRLVAKFSVAAMVHLLGVVWREEKRLVRRLAWTLKTPLYAFTQNLAQYLGARSARSGRGRILDRIDAWLRRGV